MNANRKSYVFSLHAEPGDEAEDRFFDMLEENIAKVWNLLYFEIQQLSSTVTELGYLEGTYVLAKLEREEITAVSERYVFVQRYFVPNVWHWPVTPRLEGGGVPTKDFPLNYNPMTSDFRIVGWRPKVDGVPYQLHDNALVGEKKEDGQAERIVLPPYLRWIQYAERVRDTFFVLYPYKEVSADIDVDGVKYRIQSHKWRTGPVRDQEEGVILLTDRGEYRLKVTPTTEIEQDGQVWEVCLRGQCLAILRPRHTAKWRTESDAKSYLSRQPFLAMYDLYVPENMNLSSEEYYNVTKSMDDNIVIAKSQVQESDRYVNAARVYTSAKALIQDKYGRFLLIREGSKMWDLPGGKCDFLDEPPSQIIRRELKEELDWEIPFTSLCFKNLRIAEASIAFLYHFVVKPFETPSNARWFTVDEYLRLTQKEMVSWLPSLFSDIVSIDRDFAFETEEPRFRLLQRSRQGVKCNSTVNVHSMMDEGGNPVEIHEGAYVYRYPVVPGTGRLWSEIESEYLRELNDVTADQSEASRQQREEDYLAWSDSYLYHQQHGDGTRLWGRRLARGTAQFTVVAGTGVQLNWTYRDFDDPVIYHIYAERAVSLREIQAYYPRITQEWVDTQIQKGRLIARKIGEWTYYSVK